MSRRTRDRDSSERREQRPRRPHSSSSSSYSTSQGTYTDRSSISGSSTRSHRSSRASNSLRNFDVSSSSASSASSSSGRSHTGSYLSIEDPRFFGIPSSSYGGSSRSSAGSYLSSSDDFEPWTISSTAPSSPGSRSDRTIAPITGRERIHYHPRSSSDRDSDTTISSYGPGQLVPYHPSSSVGSDTGESLPYHSRQAVVRYQPRRTEEPSSSSQAPSESDYTGSSSSTAGYWQEPVHVPAHGTYPQHAIIVERQLRQAGIARPSVHVATDWVPLEEPRLVPRTIVNVGVEDRNGYYRGAVDAATIWERPGSRRYFDGR
ncbi:hypothetical protein SCAR479_13758 [Seiridium cardinale]|uniref:Uncharacterized protein n=1 Tax=Seiridium cardinale TaxID=138064 RepID=A0ABR2X741_9PEZI